MMKRIITVLLLAGALLACESPSLYSEYAELPGNTWSKSNRLKFHVQLGAAGTHDLILGLQHVYGYPFDKLIIKLYATSPTGEERVRDYEVPVRTEDQYFSDCSGDYCDMEYVMETGIEMEGGSWHFEIEHQMPTDPLPLVMEVGLIVRSPEQPPI